MGYREWALATMALVVPMAGLAALILFPASNYGDHAGSWNSHKTAIFACFSRFLWALCVAGITLLCYYNCLPLTNRFLSHPFWIPLVRLCYGIYIVHPMIIQLGAGVRVQYFPFSIMSLLFQGVGFFAFSCFGAIVLWAIVESPAV